MQTDIKEKILQDIGISDPSQNPLVAEGHPGASREEIMGFQCQKETDDGNN